MVYSRDLRKKSSIIDISQNPKYVPGIVSHWPFGISQFLK